MKMLALVGMALLAAQNYPPPFPREGVTKLFENDRVVVWAGTFVKNRPTPMHEHTMDLVGVFLSDGKVNTTLLDGTTREGKPFGNGSVVFGPKGVIHVEESLVDGTRARGIELKNVGDQPTVSKQ